MMDKVAHADNFIKELTLATNTEAPAKAAVVIVPEAGV
jgi:hypothetical protein